MQTADLFELELSSGGESAAHQNGEDSVTGHVVTIDDLNCSAWMIGENIRVIQRDANEEQRNRPPDRPVHPLTTVAFDVVSEVPERRRVGHRQSRGTQELAYYLLLYTVYEPRGQNSVVRRRRGTSSMSVGLVDE